jgi:hypothetical protein
LPRRNTAGAAALPHFSTQSVRNLILFGGKKSEAFSKIGRAISAAPVKVVRLWIQVPAWRSGFFPPGV